MNQLKQQDTPNTIQASIKGYKTPSRTEVAACLILLVFLLGGVFLGQHYAYLYAEGAEQTSSSVRNVSAVVFGLPAIMYFVTRRWRRPGRIALGVIGIGFVTLIAASAIGSHTKSMKMQEAVDAIGRFAPEYAASLKAGSTLDGVSRASIMASSLALAIEQAPDSAVVRFAVERFAIIKSDSPAALKWCAGLLKGEENRSFQLSGNEKLRMMSALGHLYSAAAVERQSSPSEYDRMISAVALTTIYKKIDPSGILNSDEKIKMLSEQQQCEINSSFLYQLQLVPPKIGAGVIRLLMAN